MEDKELLELFKRFGDVESARIIKSRESGKSMGYGFVVMPDDFDAQIAIKEVNGKVIKERPLRVKIA